MPLSAMICIMPGLYDHSIRLWIARVPLPTSNYWTRDYTRLQIVQELPPSNIVSKRVVGESFRIPRLDVFNCHSSIFFEFDVIRRIALNR
jgi:hypothetical protein